jgi:hypothetical protein
MKRRTVYTNKGLVTIVSHKEVASEPLVPITEDRFAKATARLKEAFGQGMPAPAKMVDVDAQRRVIVKQQREAESITKKGAGKTPFVDIDLRELKKQMQRCYEAGCKPDLNRIPWKEMRAPVVKRVLEIIHQFFGPIDENGEREIELDGHAIEFDVINIGSIIRVSRR